MRRAPSRGHEEVGVVGLDLSLTRAAALYLPPGWKPGTWTGVRWSVITGGDVVGKNPQHEAERLARICDGLLPFIFSHEARRIYVEDYAFSRQQSSLTKLAELGGAVKLDCMRRGMVVVPVNQTTARALFLGKLPPKERAQATHAAIQRMRPPWGVGSDEGDALVVANAGRHLLGLSCATLGA